MEWVLEPTDRAAVRRLRHQIVAALGRIAAPDTDLTDAEIVIAELLSNALTHTPGKSWISLRWDGVHPLLSVSDLGPGFTLDAPVSEASLSDTSTSQASLSDTSTSQASLGEAPGGTVRPGLVDRARAFVPCLPEDPWAEAGRGLYLVAQLALDVAVSSRTTGGTVVSVTLDLKRLG